MQMLQVIQECLRQNKPAGGVIRGQIKGCCLTEIPSLEHSAGDRIR